jgi:hypothetical protein
MARYPVTGVHIRLKEQTTVYSCASPDPDLIMEFMAEFIDKHANAEVLFDHNYETEKTLDQEVNHVR